MVSIQAIREARSLVEVFRLASELFGDHPAFCPRNSDGTYGAVSFREIHGMGLDLATALIDLGVQAREHVALLADNRVEWAVADFGVLMAGAADVPRGTDVMPAEIEYILEHADVRVVFIEHTAMWKKFERCRPRLPRVTTCVMMDRTAERPEGVLSLWDLVERGRALRAAGDRRAEERMAGVQPEDTFTLIYTSGTTGRPKGVRLTHANMVSQIRNLPIRLTTADRLLSVLPIWHIYERVAMMLTVGNGCSTWYTSVRTIADDLKTVRPTLMASAPRLWESLYQKILHNVRQCNPLRRAMFRTAYFFSRHLRHAAYFIEGRRIDLVGRRWWTSAAIGLGNCVIYVALLAPYLVMDGLVTRKLRDILGGRFRGTISGGGALPQHVDEFFNYIGLPVLEGYGMTESCPVIAVRTWKKRIIGTVGPIWPETEVRIVEIGTGRVLYPDPTRADGGRGLKGEIHARGPQVTPGYYKEAELTSRVLKDGWLATGDIGLMTFNDCLKIIGRCKETIVLLSGENVEPLPIENKLCESRFIQQCMVVGQDQKHLAALIVTDLERFKDTGVTATSVEELGRCPVAERIINAEIKAQVCGATGFRHFEMVHDWRILPKSFEVGDELTSTLKLKRHVITEKYADVIRDIYHVPKGGRDTRL
jgi:long-chain acyl-CoA synthetase